MVKIPDNDRRSAGMTAWQGAAARQRMAIQSIHERERTFELSRRSTPDSTDLLTGPMARVVDGVTGHDGQSPSVGV